MLDSDVYVTSGNGGVLVHEREWMHRDRVAWLSRIARPEWQDKVPYQEQLHEAASRLAFVDPGDPAAGLACIAYNAGAGVRTVGTLKATPSFQEYENEFWGAMDCLPAGPQRSAGKIRAEQHLPRWATDQAKVLAGLNVKFPERQYAAQRVAQFEGDATPIAGMLLNQEWAPLDQILEYLIEGGKLFAPLKQGFGRGAEHKTLMTMVRENHSGWVDSYLPGDLEYLVETLEGPDTPGSDDLYRVPTSVDPAECGFCMLLTRRGRERGYLIEGELIERMDFARYVGEASKRDGRVPGKVIGSWALALSAIRLD